MWVQARTCVRVKLRVWLYLSVGQSILSVHCKMASKTRHIERLRRRQLNEKRILSAACQEKEKNLINSFVSIIHEGRPARDLL